MELGIETIVDGIILENGIVAIDAKIFSDIIRKLPDNDVTIEKDGNHPGIIIFDEPTASLDPLNAAMLEEVLEKLSREGKTLLLSTHDVDFAYRFADRILVFDNGRILADGTPLEVF